MASAKAAPKTSSTAPRARAIKTRAEWDARALQLAEEHHLVYRAKCIGPNAGGWYVFSTPSSRDDSVRYVQQVNPITGECKCGCTAGSYGNPCGHAGSALHAWRQIANAMSEAGKRASRDLIAFGEWLSVRGY